MTARRVAGAGGGAAVIPLATLGALLAPFLLLASPVEVDRTRVMLPASHARAEAGRGAASIAIARETEQEGWGSIVYGFSDGEETSRILGGPTDIYLAAVRVLAEDPARPFVIKADGAVHYGAIDDVVEQLRKAGVREITFATAPAARRAAP